MKKFEKELETVVDYLRESTFGADGRWVELARKDIIRIAGTSGLGTFWIRANLSRHPHILKRLIPGQRPLFRYVPADKSRLLEAEMRQKANTCITETKNDIQDSMGTEYALEWIALLYRRVGKS